MEMAGGTLMIAYGVFRTSNWPCGGPISCSKPSVCPSIWHDNAARSIRSPARCPWHDEQYASVDLDPWCMTILERDGCLVQHHGAQGEFQVRHPPGGLDVVRMHMHTITLHKKNHSPLRIGFIIWLDRPSVGPVRVVVKVQDRHSLTPEAIGIVALNQPWYSNFAAESGERDSEIDIGFSVSAEQEDGVVCAHCGEPMRWKMFMMLELVQVAVPTKRKAWTP